MDNSVKQQETAPDKVQEALRSASREMTATTALLMYQIDAALYRMDMLDLRDHASR